MDIANNHKSLKKDVYLKLFGDVLATLEGVESTLNLKESSRLLKM